MFKNPRLCYLVQCVALVQQCKASRDKSVELRAAQLRHPNKISEVHGKAHLTPKHPFALHLLEQVAHAVQKFGHAFQPDCSAGEREVGTVKRAANQVKNIHTRDPSGLCREDCHMDRVQGRHLAP